MRKFFSNAIIVWLFRIIEKINRKGTSLTIEYNMKGLMKRGVLSIGKRTYGVPDIRYFRTDRCKIFIGNYCSIGPDVVIIPGGLHPHQRISTFPFAPDANTARPDEFPKCTSGKDLSIGHDVWIASGARILSGSHLGNGCIIASGAVVKGRVPPYAVYGGNPAQLLFYRFTKERIDRLLEIGWWNWDEAKIAEAMPFLSGDDVDGFIGAYGTSCGAEP